MVYVQKSRTNEIEFMPNGKYMRIDGYISSYIISGDDLKNNSNYAINELYTECKGQHSDVGWSGACGGHHLEKSSYTIKPSLMHEHLVPCTCSDSTISLLLQDKQTRSPVLYVP